MELLKDNPVPSLEKVKDDYIYKVLEMVEGNRTLACEILGISLRGIRLKIAQFHVNGKGCFSDSCFHCRN